MLAGRIIGTADAVCALPNIMRARCRASDYRMKRWFPAAIPRSTRPFRTR